MSRFTVLKIPEYTFEQFKEIAVLRLKEEDIDENIASTIAHKVWYELDSNDIRDTIKIGRLAHKNEDIDLMINAMKIAYNPK